jgi:hypothetical protein
MRLYLWTDPQESDRILLTARLTDPDDVAGQRTFSGVALSADPPQTGSEEHTAVDIPSEIIEPFRVRPGRYLVPPSVVRAYQALRERH